MMCWANQLSWCISIITDVVNLAALTRQLPLRRTCSHATTHTGYFSPRAHSWLGAKGLGLPPPALSFVIPAGGPAHAMFIRSASVFTNVKPEPTSRTARPACSCISSCFRTSISEFTPLVREQWPKNRLLKWNVCQDLVLCLCESTLLQMTTNDFIYYIDIFFPCI